MGFVNMGIELQFCKMKISRDYLHNKILNITKLYT